MGSLYGLPREKNGRINTFFKSVGVRASDKDTNYKVTLLIKAGIIDKKNPEKFVKELAEKYGDFVLSIEDLFKRYIKQIIEFENEQLSMDKKNANLLKKKIEETIENDANNINKIKFADMIEEKYNEVDKYAECIEAIRCIEENLNLLAEQHTKIPKGTYEFFANLHDAMLRGEIKTEYLVSGNFANDFSNWINRVVESEDIVNLPKKMEKLKRELICKLTDKMSQNLETLLNKHRLNVTALHYMQIQYPEYQNLSLEGFLAIIGKQATPGKGIKQDEIKIMEKLKQASILSNFANEINAAMDIMSKEDVNNAGDFEKRINKQYQEAEQMAKLIERNPRYIKEQLSKPISSEDSSLLKTLKNQYSKRKISEILSLPVRQRVEILLEPINEDDPAWLKGIKKKYLYIKQGIENEEERDSIFDKSPEEIDVLLGSEISPEDSEYLQQLKKRHAIDKTRKGDNNYLQNLISLNNEIKNFRKDKETTILKMKPEELEKLLSEPIRESDGFVLTKLKELYSTDENSVMQLSKRIRDSFENGGIVYEITD